MKSVDKRWTPSNWVSKIPFGIGEQRPNNFAEVFRAVWENRDSLPYALRILNEGVCDGCALGTTGMRDWTLEGIHLCNVRLRLLRLNTMPPIDPKLLENAAGLSQRSERELRSLGRLTHPMLRERGDVGFRQISWDQALDRTADLIRNSLPERIAFYLTSRGMSNENYYAAQKAVRSLGTNSIDNAARVCHSPSTGALKQAIGAAATTCSYSDWMDSDLIVFIGTNIANNQPVAVKYLHYAKKANARIVVVNPYREPGMERYWIPSVPESALFGTKLADQFFLINVGGDIAFINGTIKHMVENDWIDRDFVDGYAADFDRLEAELDRQRWPEIERQAGVDRAEMLAFARMIGEARKAVFVWAMGITQHTFGEDNVRAIVNLALTRGFVGREGSGLMPIRGHSGVQGGAEMGAYATVLPGGLAINAENSASLSQAYGFPISQQPGLTAPRMIEAAARNELDLLFSAGGNFIDVLPEPAFVETALQQIPLRVHMDLVLNRQMLVEPGEAAILLPAMTRYEIPGGVTQTSTERRVMFSPEVAGPRHGEPRAEWEVFLDLARRVQPQFEDQLSFASTADIRAEIANVIPLYEGIQDLQKAGDQFQYGGKHLCEGWKFQTPDGKAHFTPVHLPQIELPEGAFLMATRRGKQFNSMVHEKRDAITGAVRSAVMISEVDAAGLGIVEGDRVRLWNERAELIGRAVFAPVKPGSLQVHWPEGNVLIDRSQRSSEVDIPDYNAVVWLESANSSGNES